MTALLFDPWQWIRDNADEPERAEQSPALATLATLAAPGDWPSLPEEWRDGLARLRQDGNALIGSTEAWARLVADTQRLADDWASQALALGWTTLDLFGVDPKLARRLDRDGLAASLEGRIVKAITSEAATLLTPSGGTVRHYRRDKVGAVPVWSLLASGEGVTPPPIDRSATSPS